MLVLSRKAGQELVIGENIRITVNRVGGSRVTLGISAPSDVRIVRGELARIVDSFQHPEETDAAELSIAAEGTDDGEPFQCSAVWPGSAADALASLRPHLQ